jgi:hypothetical protein
VGDRRLRLGAVGDIGGHSGHDDRARPHLRLPSTARVLRGVPPLGRARAGDGDGRRRCSATSPRSSSCSRTCTRRALPSLRACRPTRAFVPTPPSAGLECRRPTPAGPPAGLGRGVRERPPWGPARRVASLSWLLALPGLQARTVWTTASVVVERSSVSPGGRVRCRRQTPRADATSADAGPTSDPRRAARPRRHGRPRGCPAAPDPRGGAPTAGPAAEASASPASA